MQEENLVSIEVVVKIWIKDTADVQAVISDMNYDFIHEDIVDMEIKDVYTEF